MQSLIGEWGGCLPAGPLLGSVLVSQGKKHSGRKGTSAMKVLPHYSPFTAHSVMGTAAGVGSHSTCIHECGHAYTHACTQRATGREKTYPVLLYVHSQKPFFFFYPCPHMLSSLPSSSLESYHHKAEITLLSSNQEKGER